MEGRRQERWSDIRDNLIKKACKYQTTMKLWDAQRHTGTLHQEYPEFLQVSDLQNPAKDSLFN